MVAESSSPYGRLTEIVGGIAVVRDRWRLLAIISFMSFHSTGGETWTMADCCNDMQDLLTSVNDPDKHIRIGYVGRPDVMFASVVCLSLRKSG